ncbi:MAG: MBL fold metallo-hydrolase [Bacteroidales bacterium]
MSLKFLSLSSGSSGNCYYLGNDKEGLIIDAGISARKIRRILEDNNIDKSTILGLCITHDHSDHIISAGYLGERWGIPIYATKGTIDGMNRNFRMVEKIYTAHRFILKDVPFFVGGFEITAFEVLHDGSDNVGYLVRYDGLTFAFATDLGCLTPTVKKYLLQSDCMVIESNYDINMLRFGRYAEYLKKRIQSDTGHLCNDITASFLAEGFTNRLLKIFLCHISAENNTPELAFDTVSKALSLRGINVGEDVDVVPLARTKPSPMYIFD